MKLFRHFWNSCLQSSQLSRIFKRKATPNLQRKPTFSCAVGRSHLLLAWWSVLSFCHWRFNYIGSVKARQPACMVQAIAHIDEVEAAVVQMRASGYPEVAQTAERLSASQSATRDASFSMKLWLFTQCPRSVSRWFRVSGVVDHSIMRSWWFWSRSAITLELVDKVISGSRNTKAVRKSLQPVLNDALHLGRKNVCTIRIGIFLSIHGVYFGDLAPPSFWPVKKMEWHRKLSQPSIYSTVQGALMHYRRQFYWSRA